MYVICGPPDGYVAGADDCDDDDPSVYPGALDEPCDGVDADCDGAGGEAVAAAVEGIEYTTIQDALGAAPYGGTVSVCPGTHTEELEIGGVELTLASWSGSAEDTVLDGEGQRRILTIGRYAAVTLSDLTLQNAAPQPSYPNQSVWGGAVLSDAGDLFIERCLFLGNEVNDAGAAVYAAQPAADVPLHLSIVGSLFEGNRADEGGAGVYASSVTYPLEPVSVQVADSAFVGNWTGISGAGLKIGGWGEISLDLSDSSFFENVAENSSGAVDAGSWDSLVVKISNSTFQGNVGHYAVGIGTWGSTHLEVDGCLFDGNPGGALYGLAGAEADFAIRDSIFTANLAPDYNGAMAFGCLWLAEPYTVSLVDTWVNGNSGRKAGGIIISSGNELNTVELFIEGGGITDNEGGGVYLDDWPDNVLTSVNVDWGTGPTDNTPFDISAGGVEYSLFGAGEEFVCYGDGTCE